MTAFPQSSPPGPEPFRFPETIRRCVSGPRKRSSYPTIHRPTPAADLRPSSVRPWPEPVPGVVLFDSERLNTSPISHSVCLKARASIYQCVRTMPLNTKYRADPTSGFPMKKAFLFLALFAGHLSYGVDAGDSVFVSPDDEALSRL